MVATELASLYDRDLARLVQELRAFPDTSRPYIAWFVGLLGAVLLFKGP